VGLPVKRPPDSHERQDLDVFDVWRLACRLVQLVLHPRDTQLETDGLTMLWSMTLQLMVP